MAKFACRGLLWSYALLGCGALLSSCGDDSSSSSAGGGTSATSGGAADAGGDGDGTKAGASAAGSPAQGGKGGSGQSGGNAGAAEMAGEGPGPSTMAGESSGGAAGEAPTLPGDAGAGGQGVAPCTDSDGDGYGDNCSAPDCDDQDPLVNPGMLELADDARDNDCQGGDLKAKDGPGYYVNGSDPNCSDGQGATGTKAQPYCTIELAVVKAYQATAEDDPVGRSLFVAKGTYPNTVGTPRSVRVYGGYDASDWSYDPVSNVTTIGGADAMKDLDNFQGWEMWVNVNGKANAVFQGFHIVGGKRPGAPIKAVEINSAGKVELYDNVIVAGEGFQTLGVNIFGDDKNDPSTSNVWLIENRISAGTPTNSSNYGLNNLGTAVLWGNVIDMGQGKSGSFGAAVQNYGVMTLVNNVLNGGDFGGGVDSSYGLINAKADGLPEPGVAAAYHNVIFGGRGTASSVGVSNNAELKLVNNVLGDRTPGPLTFAARPSLLAVPLLSGFAGKTLLVANDLFNLTYSDEPNAPNPNANRRLFQYSDNTTHPVDDLAVVNGCAWTGCVAGSGQNLAVSPGFTADFHLSPGSALISQGADPGHTAGRGLPNLDIDHQLRPVGGGWDIGMDER